MPPDTNASNQMALVSFLLALVFPVGVLFDLALEGYFQQRYTSVLPTGVGSLESMVFALALASLIAALFIGHTALRRAKQYPPPQALRGYAITGLVIGYVSLAVSLAAAVTVVVWGVVLFFLGGGLPNG